MMLPFGEPITVITRTADGRDSDGNTIYAETSVEVVGAFDPAIGYESTDGRDTVVSQPQALLPYGAPVEPTSVLVIHGKRYEVDGEPNSWRSPLSGWEAGLAVPLKRVTG